MKLNRRGRPALVFAVMLVLGPIIAACAAVHNEVATRQAASAHAASVGVAGWTETGSYTENALTAGEGVTTVTPPKGTEHELYRGLASTPPRLALQSWLHVGDPDSAGAGYIIDPYQGSSRGKKKMFLLTTPSGATYQYVHTLVRGELFNNSFDAMSPDKQWLVAGEWGKMSHLQVYPAPFFNRWLGPHIYPPCIWPGS